MPGNLHKTFSFNIKDYLSAGAAESKDKLRGGSGIFKKVNGTQRLNHLAVPTVVISYSSEIRSKTVSFIEKNIRIYWKMISDMYYIQKNVNLDGEKVSHFVSLTNPIG